MISLLGLRFVQYSCDFNVLRVQRIVGFLDYYYPQINEARKPVRMGVTKNVSTGKKLSCYINIMYVKLL